MNKNKLSMALRRNYRELIFVIAAFAIMALAAYLFIGHILRYRLLAGAEAILTSVEANAKAGLSEAETTLLNSCYILEGMLYRNASKQEILDYLIFTTEWMRRKDQGLFGFYGIYGYINGEFYDGIGFSPDSDFIPQKRPWYQTAIRSGSSVAYTAPYKDSLSGQTVISSVRTIDNADGSKAGVISVDINIGWLEQYVTSFALAAGGYGMLLSQNMTLMSHPDKNFLGSQLQELGGSYGDIARILRSGENVSALRILDSDGKDVIVFFKKIFNGWYVGSVTPRSQFYRDLYFSALILFLLGLALSLPLCFILLRFSTNRMRSDEESKAKSSFLARMSHEIRTPMNAITGMTELLLRGELPGRSKNYVMDLKQASSNLLSIINDLLDFSKIEAGKMEIIPAKYLFTSFINDTVSVVKTWLIDKSVKLFTNIDSNIPNSLTGDEVRMRQILTNLLSNAVKFTENGHITLTIITERREKEKIWLRITVADTGCGINDDDLKKLFGDFFQIDMNKRKGSKNTGLGLAIAKRLCVAMGGDITVESEYGKGSAFTILIPQVISDEKPFAAVDEPDKKSVLLYEDRPFYAQSALWSLKSLKTPHAAVSDNAAFYGALFKNEWAFVFASPGLYEKISPLMERPDRAFSGGKKPSLVLMVEPEFELLIPDVRFLSLPANTLSIANVLNDKTTGMNFTKDSGCSGAVHISLPNARLLVVDDIATNLKVAEGLLAPYNAAVDTCQSGMKAIEMVRSRHYDLVFMDHMMPGMDGIETTAAIRALNGKRFKDMPIISLTANAVTGMREMFISKGFNDFLPKPIDLYKLDEILIKWIPKGKRGGKKVSEAPEKKVAVAPSAPPLKPQILSIPNVNAKQGIALTGGTVDGYRMVLAIFRKDVEERLAAIQKIPDKTELHNFTIQVHAIKSASASIGAANASAKAAQLEAAGKSGDMPFIQENLPVFTECLSVLIKDIRAALGQTAPDSGIDSQKNLTDEKDIESEKKCIILVDDNPANLRIGKNIMSDEYTVATAPSAKKLFSLLENNRPILILMDINMPEMDGYEAIKILKSKPETKDIPVIFLKELTETMDEENIRLMGAEDYVTKPFNPKALSACIKKYAI
ncbi:MAG: response regulator [Deferribacteraceae bacterium]|jgi:signal transduction histidine kinase/DNA-binding response OmpR family regulator/HPt (histidine-containing phosphotransfer) domain-containing protein|nr:response regulator [Deferribacteraceae bacterium]